MNCKGLYTQTKQPNHKKYIFKKNSTINMVITKKAGEENFPFKQIVKLNAPPKIAFFT